MSNSSILPTDKILSGVTTPGQSGSENDVNERVPSITGASQSDSLVSYPEKETVPIQDFFLFPSLLFFTLSKN